MIRDTIRAVSEKFHRDGFRALLVQAAKETFFDPPFRRFILPRLTARILTADEVYRRSQSEGSLWTFDDQVDCPSFPVDHPAFDPVPRPSDTGYSRLPEATFDVQNVTLFGPGAIIRDATGSFLFLMNSVQNFEANLRYAGVQLMIERIGARLGFAGSLTRPTRYECATSLVTHVGQHYGHWLMEYLPQLMGLSVYEKQTGRTPLVLVNRNPSPWMLDSLELLGIPNDRVVEWTDRHAYVDRYVQTFPNAVGTTRDESSMSPVAYNWLRRQLLDAVDTDAKNQARRYYISRQGMRTRHVSNFQEIVPVLEAYDIEVVRTETMTFEEQVRAFADAELFVGPRGSGMHNVLFARQAAVIELTTPKWRLQAQPLLCAALGHRYTHLTGTDYADDPTSTAEFRKSPFFVDPEELGAVLNRVVSAIE